MKNILLLICILAFSGIVRSEDQTATRYWLSLLRDGSPGQIVDALSDPKKPQWPEIRSVHWLEKQSPDKQKEYRARLEMPEMLLEKLAEDFQQNPVKTAGDLSRCLSRYGAAADRLKVAEGYANAILVDVLQQMRLCRIAEHLTLFPDSAKQCEVELQKLNLPPVDVLACLNRFKAEDAGLEHLVLNAKVDGTKFLGAQLIDAGFSEAVAVGWLTDGRGINPRRLLKETSVVHLLVRMAITGGQQVTLKGFSEYLIRGGKTDDATLSSFSKFESTMGRDLYKYGNHLFGGNFLDPGGIQNFRKRFIGPEREEALGAWHYQTFR